MDLQKLVDMQCQCERNEEMKTSRQLTLGELICKLEACPHDDMAVQYDDGAWPTHLDSWRGIYAELAMDAVVDRPRITVQDLLHKCRQAIGATFFGYKGGEYVMGKNTPVWRDNYGESTDTAIVGVKVTEQGVILETTHRPRFFH